MRTLIAVVCCTLCLLVLSGCKPDRTVHVDSTCKIVYDDGSSADPLELQPGYKVKWVNDNDNEVTIGFDSADLFGPTSFTIKPGKSKTTKVKPGAAGYESDFRVECGEGGGSGNPQVKVGDGGGP